MVVIAKDACMIERFIILLLGCQYGNPSRKMGFFSVSVKVLLSGVFLHRVFYAYFVRFERTGVMCRFLWWTQENI